MKVVRLSALRTGRLYPPGTIPGTHFCYRLSQPQGHCAARRIMSVKNSKDTIGNQTRDLLACSAVPQPTVPLPVPNAWRTCRKSTKTSGSITSVLAISQLQVKTFMRSYLTVFRACTKIKNNLLLHQLGWDPSYLWYHHCTAWHIFVICSEKRVSVYYTTKETGNYQVWGKNLVV
jgi:hypothetical protein